MYQDASCGTDPFDEADIDTDTASRWFMGLSRSIAARPDQKPVTGDAETKSGGRSHQRYEEENIEGNYAHVEIDPMDIIDDDGMLHLPVNTFW